MSLPIAVIQHKIFPWLQEFYRLDMMERVAAARAENRLRYICEDVRANTPVYVLSILTQSAVNIQIPFTLPNCDPNRIRTENRIPESHISSFYRRSLAACPRFLLER
jgi:hypothetical protein